MSGGKRDAHDKLVLVVVGGLLLLALIALGIVGATILRTAEPSELLLGALIATLSGTVGALTAVLTQTGRGQVEVTNDASNPVPTTDPVGG